MTQQPAPIHADLVCYEIRLQGQLGPHWAADFHGMSLTWLEDGTTVLCGPVRDQAALHGLLRQVENIGIPLLSLNRSPRDLDRGASDPHE